MQIYNCKSEAFLHKKAAFLRLYNCKSVTFLRKNAAFLQLYICKKAAFLQLYNYKKKQHFNVKKLLFLKKQIFYNYIIVKKQLFYTDRFFYTTYIYIYIKLFQETTQILSTYGVNELFIWLFYLRSAALLVRYETS